MAIRADRDPKYYFRFWLIGLFALGFALYCLYDGFINYPLEQERALAYENLLREKSEQPWAEYAQEHGWSTKLPEGSLEEKEFDAKVKMQFIMAAVSGLVGLAVLFNVISSRGRWIEADKNGLTTSWGQNFSFDRITSIDKKKWRKKGIAKIRYEDAGSERTFVLDDFKFKRDPTDEILELMEAKAGVDKITGGLPEGSDEAPVEETTT